jgi:hypothetical protein
MISSEHERARFAEYPGRALGVDASWEVREGAVMTSLVPADGAVDVVVRFNAGVPHLEVEAATVSAFTVSLAESARVLAVRLVLGHGEPLRAQTTSLAQAATSLWRRDALTLSSLEELVAGRIVTPPSLVRDFVAHAKAHHGALPLSGRSARSLQRAARQWLGLRPKTLLRIERARAAALALIAGEPVVEVALRLGFTDQPHLTRELRTLIGTTPAACRKSARRADAPVAP